MIFDKEAKHVVAIDKDDFELFSDLIEGNDTVFNLANNVMTIDFPLNGHSRNAVKRILDRIACFAQKYANAPSSFVFEILDVKYLEEYGCGYALISCTSPEKEVTPITLRTNMDLFAMLSKKITCPEDGKVINLSEYAKALNRWLIDYHGETTWYKMTDTYYSSDNSEDYYMFRLMEMAIEESGYDLTNVHKITIHDVIHDSDVILVNGSIE